MAWRRIIETREVELNGGNSGIIWSQTAGEPAAGDIDIDNDGVVAPSHQFIADLSQIASSVLGRQVSMMRPVILHGVSIGIRPVDDVTDNDESAFFGGRLFFYPATDHRLEALGLARRVENLIESQEVDTDSFLLSTEVDYSGFRYGWDLDNQVKYQTAGYPGGGDWKITQIFSAYNLMTAPDQANALFTGRVGEAMGMQWVCALASGVGTGDSPPPGGHSADWIRSSLRHEILPIMKGTVEYSSSDEEGAVDDDYTVHVELDFSVWE